MVNEDLIESLKGWEKLYELAITVKTLKAEDTIKRPTHTPVAASYLSLFGVRTDACPFVWWLRSREVLGAATEETHVVDRSKVLWLLQPASSAVCEPVTSFQSCWSSVGIMPETNKLDN